MHDTSQGPEPGHGSNRRLEPDVRQREPHHAEEQPPSRTSHRRLARRRGAPRHRLWPDEDDAADALVDLLSQAADATEDTDDAGTFARPVDSCARYPVPSSPTSPPP